MIPVPETVRECLRLGGFQWSKGKIYVPDAATKKLKLMAQTDESLEQPYNQVDHIFAIDANHVFVMAQYSGVLALPCMLPIRIRRDDTEFLDVKLKNVLFSHAVQSIVDIEGFFCGQGEVIETPLVKRLGSYIDAVRGGVYIAGLRLCGVYVAAFTQQQALECFAESMNLTLKQELAKRLLLLSTKEEREGIANLALHDIRKEFLADTKD